MPDMTRFCCASQSIGGKSGRGEERRRIIPGMRCSWRSLCEWKVTGNFNLSDSFPSVPRCSDSAQPSRRQAGRLNS